MTLELRTAGRYQLVDRTVVAERAGLGWWLLYAVASPGGERQTWAIAPDGRIYQGNIEVLQSTSPATFRPLGPLTDLTASDLEFLGEGRYGDDGIDQINRRAL